MPHSGAAGDPSVLLEAARDAFAANAWREAYDTFTESDSSTPLGAADLELMATAASMLGRDEEWLGILERAHYRHCDAGATLRAVRCAFWIGIWLARRGEIGRATGWFGRAHRLLQHEEGENVEEGYLLLPEVFRHEAEGNLAAAAETAHAAAEMGDRFGEPDLFALATHEHGEILIRSGKVEAGLALLDEAMVTVTGYALSPFVTGIVYCGTISACRAVFEVQRAAEWTTALSEWCDRQPELLAFTGRCLVHRAEILQIRGSWQEALEQARQAATRYAETTDEPAAGYALYREGELHRLQGDVAAAEDAYRRASQCGYEPQPGLSLLRLAQGRGAAATAAIARAVAERTQPLDRAAVLPAQIEITLAEGQLDEADAACSELESIAEQFDTTMLGAMAAHARGAVELARERPRDAIVALRSAVHSWQELGAPYEGACARVLIALACRELGDDDGVSLELSGARAVFERLGATPDVAWVESIDPAGKGRKDWGLTRRELEVLRLVASGKSNREIASVLVISEHTVARHVQNIFAKLDVPSRTAAGAFAFEHGLV